MTLPPSYLLFNVEAAVNRLRCHFCLFTSCSSAGQGAQACHGLAVAVREELWPPAPAAISVSVLVRDLQFYDRGASEAAAE